VYFFDAPVSSGIRSTLREAKLYKIASALGRRLSRDINSVNDSIGYRSVPGAGDTTEKSGEMNGKQLRREQLSATGNDGRKKNFHFFYLQVA